MIILNVRVMCFDVVVEDFTDALVEADLSLAPVLVFQWCRCTWPMLDIEPSLPWVIVIYI